MKFVPSSVDFTAAFGFHDKRKKDKKTNYYQKYIQSEMILTES